MWQVELIDEAKKDLKKLDHSVQMRVLKSLVKVSSNPKAKSDGGYGSPLGNMAGNDLTGLFKIKLRDAGIRIVYKLLIDDSTMKVIIIAARTDMEVYKEAARRRIKHGL